MASKLKLRLFLVPLLAAALFGAFGLSGCARLHRFISRASGNGSSSGDIPSFGKQATETDFRAVLMSNGMVLFGKLHGLGTPYPVLTDVYYVQNVQDPTTKKSTAVLIKRGKEWHAPDRTVLNANQIIMIEPVTIGSKVMDLIEKEEKQN